MRDYVEIPQALSPIPLKNILLHLFGSFILQVMMGIAVCSAETIELTIPTSHPSWQYYHELVKTAFENEGYTVHFTKLDDRIPEKRVMRMLEIGENGPLFYWRRRTPQRDQIYTPIGVPINSGLAGKRVLFIRKGTQSLFDKVKTLNEFRKLNLVAGVGQGWSSNKIWEYNNLPFKGESGDWRVIYKKLERGNRGIDYIHKGINEIFIEEEKYPYLEIEKNLILQYESEWFFYLSKKYSHLQPLFENVLRKANEKGLIVQIQKKYFPQVYEELEKRIVIKLKMPPE